MYLLPCKNLHFLYLYLGHDVKICLCCGLWGETVLLCVYKENSSVPWPLGFSSNCSHVVGELQAEVMC